MEWIIQLLAGAVGGFIGGMTLKKYSMGTTGNTVAGVVGGVIGGQLLGGTFGGGNVGLIIAGVIGGVLVMAIAGVIKNMMAK